MKRSSEAAGVGFIGYGELSAQVSALLETGRVERHFFDDPMFDRKMPGAHPFKDYANPRFEKLAFYVCLGYKHLETKTRIIRHLAKLRRRPETFVHRTAFVNNTAKLGAGTIVYPMCNIDRNARIAAGVILHNSAVVSHDAQIGDGSYLAPGVVVCGRAVIGSNVFIGAGAVIADGIRIGAGARIGIGTVVTGPVTARASVIGNPMRALAKPLRLERA